MLHACLRTPNGLAALAVALVAAGCGTGAVPTGPTVTTVDPTTVPTAAVTVQPPASSSSTGPGGSPMHLRVSLNGDLPDGWDVSAEGTLLSFATTGSDPGMTIEMLENREVMAEDCGLGPESGVAMTASAVVDAISGRRGLVPSGRSPVTVGGLTGEQVDLRVDPDVGVTCPGEDGGFVPLVGAMESYGWGFSGVGPAERIRLVALDVEPDQILIVLVVAPTAAARERHIEAASSIIGSLEFAIG